LSEIEALRAEVARLTAERDMQRESARFHAERAGRLSALVEAGLALADEWSCDDPGCDREGGFMIRTALGGAM
jgi:hypothetical protein